MTARVAVVGAGIAGAACATVLAAHGMDVEIIDRGRAPGGRLASPVQHGRRVDLGAAYVTVKDDDFAGVVEGWARRGLVRQWTDTVEAFGADGHERKTGPMRWAAPGGLRSLVRDLLPTPVAQERNITDLLGLDHHAVVLAMPDPQAARLLGEPDGVGWVDFDPVIAVALGYAERGWSLDASFVNDDPDLTLIADDGSRRGDGAPVLVAHTTARLARRHLTDPVGVVPAVTAAVTRILGLSQAPVWSHPHRWTFAKPTGTHADAPFGLLDSALGQGRLLGLCTDSWCPEGSPRVESAWLSGTRLGVDLARRLT